MFLITSWQKRRNAFNHDWLKNQFMPALAKFINLLGDRIEDHDFEVSFITQILPSWDSNWREALLLAQDFERGMSPRQMFDYLPLARCAEENKRWLHSLAHSLWLVRYPVREWVADTTIAAEEANSAYNRLQVALKKCDNIRSAEAIRPFREQFSDFRSRCQELATALSKFPNDVKVV
jgi:hypothetical protein